MKSMFKKIMLVFVLGTFTYSANATNVTPNSGGNGSENSFSKFISKKAGKFKRRNLESFNQYNEVVNLYYNSPVAFYNLSDQEQSEFISAAEKLKASLNDSRKQEIKDWANTVNLNQSIFEFIWASKTLSSPENAVVVNF